MWSQNCPHIETFDNSDLFPRIGLPIISTCLPFVALLFPSCLSDLSDVVPHLPPSCLALVLQIWSFRCLRVSSRCASPSLSQLFSGPPPRGGLQFFHVSAFWLHVRCCTCCCLPCQVARGGVGGGGGVGNNVAADCKIRLCKTCFRSVHVRCWWWLLFALPACTGWVGGGGGNNVPADCKIRPCKICF